MSCTARRARRVAVGALVASTLLMEAHPAAAQRERAAAAPRPGWLPRGVRIEGGITPSQRATAVANLERIERILLQVPELASPRGFEIMPSFYGGARRLGPGQTEQPNNVIEYMLRLVFFAPTRAAGEGCTCLTIRINHVQDPGAGAIHDEQGRPIYIEMARGEPLPLATQVYEGLLRTRRRSLVYVLHTSGGAPPWKTVTRADYYNAVIFDLEKRLKASEAEPGQGNEKALSSSSSTDKMRAELDSMTPTRRNMPALIDATLPEGPNATGWRMASHESPTAWRVLTPDYDFWRARRSPVEVRALLVNISIGGAGLVPAVHNALLSAFDKMDWTALNKLLDTPR